MNDEREDEEGTVWEKNVKTVVTRFCYHDHNHRLLLLLPLLL